jgi:hypothetical protein
MKPLLLMLIFIFANPTRAEEKSKKTEIVCIKISSSCFVCSDGSKRPSLKSDKILEISDYACASGDRDWDKKKRKSYLDKSTCVSLSAFCAVCADNEFRFVKKDNQLRPLEKISSDLYECATAPRTQMN